MPTETKEPKVLLISYVPEQKLMLIGKPHSKGPHFPVILNAIQGDRARDIYNELITKKNEKEVE